MCIATWNLECVMMSGVLMPGLGVHGLMGIATDIVMVPYRLSVSRCQATRLTTDPASATTYIVSYSRSPFVNRVHLANSAHDGSYDKLTQWGWTRIRRPVESARGITWQVEHVNVYSTILGDPRCQTLRSRFRDVVYLW